MLEVLHKNPAGFNLLPFVSTLQRGGTCEAHGIEGLGLQVGTKLERVGPEVAIFGLLWALLGALN